MNYAIRNLRGFVIATISLCILAAFSTARADDLKGGGHRDNKVNIPLAFASYLDANLPEQDVYIERVPGSGDVFRVTKADIDPSAELFTVTRPVAHDPLNPAAIGPYPKGASLGITLGEWRAHRGRGNYDCENGQGRLQTTFSGLVPYGVYSLRHTFAAMDSASSGSGSLNLPLVGQEGGGDGFVADEQGFAIFEHTFSPCLQLSNARIAAMLALNYHSDGTSWESQAGDYGLNAHMPLFLVLPLAEGS